MRITLYLFFSFQIEILLTQPMVFSCLLFSLSPLDGIYEPPKRSKQIGSNFSPFNSKFNPPRREKKRITNKESACGLVSIWGERVRDHIYDSFKNDFESALIRCALSLLLVVVFFHCKCYFYFDQITRRIQIQLIKILYKWMSVRVELVRDANGSNFVTFY